jgi:large subunit ribosomal protein L23
MGIIDSIKKRTPKTAENNAASADVSEVKEAKPKKSQKKAALSTATGKVALHGTAHKVLIAPIVSEKSTHQEALHSYTFLVEKDANKIEIKKAIEEVYGVKALKVRTILVDGKTTRFGRKIGRRSTYKKAIVTTAKDQRLAIHEGV